MSGLAHVFEAAGIPTIVVSLIREHTVKMRPPRALWVPFELGRPFGPPDQPALQTRVLEHALRLLAAPSGPVLEDFPEEAPHSASAETGWTCPVLFRAPATAGTQQDALRLAVRREIAMLRPWYERALAVRGRTSVGVSGLSIDDVLEHLCVPLLAASSAPNAAACTADSLRLAAEDLKAYFTEAATAQPGTVSSATVLHWFWHDTSGSTLLRALQAHFADSEDPTLRLLSALLLVPRSQA